MTLTPSDAHRIGLEAEALGAKATPASEQTPRVTLCERTDAVSTCIEYRGPHGKFQIGEFDRDEDAALYFHAIQHYASLGSWAARWAKVVEAAEAWLTARTALEAADRANSYKDEIEVFECAEKTLADEVGKARNQSK